MPAGSDIVGRALEIEIVDRFLRASAGAGGPIGLFIEGEAGVGKSTLWRAAVDLAGKQDMDVLLCAPAEVEQALSFVALRDLLDGVTTDEMDRLPPPQHQALGAALLRLPADDGADQGALGVALTSVIRRRAAPPH